jgi:hypothetical protein
MRKPLTAHRFFHIFYKKCLGTSPSASDILKKCDWFSEFATAARQNLTQKSHLVVSVVAMITTLVVMSGCKSVEAPKPPPAPVVVAPPAPPPKPTALTAEAESALKAAEQSIVEARVKRALWTAAIEQLAFARSAARVFDSDATLKHAREVVALCQLSTQQAANPPVSY